MHSIKSCLMPFSNELNSCQMFLRVLNEDPAVWLDGARHANIDISPSFPRKGACTAAQCNHTKNTIAYLKNWQNFVKSLFNTKQKSERERVLTKSHFATVCLSNAKFDFFCFFGLSGFWTEAQNKESQNCLYSVC